MKKRLCLIVMIVVLAVFALATFAVAAEFYVVKSRSGLLQVVDHKPTGQATIVKGPFTTLEEAQKALKELRQSQKPESRP